MQIPLKQTLYLLLSILGFSFDFTAQNLTESVYSRFGLGELQFGGTARQSALGQTSQGWRDASQLNLGNAASYGLLKYTAFEAGGTVIAGRQKAGDITQPTSTGTFSYLALGFPIMAKRKAGAAFGLLPYSSVGYSLAYDSTFQPGGYKTQHVFQGKGGLNKAFLGVGGTWFDKLSAGVNAGFVFGQIANNRALYFLDTGALYGYNEFRSRYITGLVIEPAIQIHHIFTDSVFEMNAQTGQKNFVRLRKIRAVIGAQYTLSGNLKGYESLTARAMRPVTNNGPTYWIPADTVLFRTDLPGSVTLPASWQVGFSIGELGKWGLAAEYGATQWSKYKSFNQSDSLQNSMRFGAGWHITPKPGRDPRKEYLNTIDYRAGFRYQQLPFALNGQRISEYSFSLGFGLPFLINRRMVSTDENARFNVSVEFVQRGTIQSQLVKEDFFRFMVGVTFMDRWFQVRKIY